jgi:copper chaperone
MATFKFKTNIKCNGCIATVTPYLNSESTIEKWNVNLQNPEKVLTAEGNELSRETVIGKVKLAGFTVGLVA